MLNFTCTLTESHNLLTLILTIIGDCATKRDTKKIALQAVDQLTSD